MHLAKLNTQSWLTTLRQIEWNFFNLIKGSYKNPIANNIHSDERMDASPASRIKQGTFVFPFLFNIILEVLVSAVRQDMEIEGISFHIWSEEII